MFPISFNKVGLGLGILILKGVAEAHAHYHIFGENGLNVPLIKGNGGDFLNMYSTNTKEDMEYNRHFQKFKYLIEENVKDPAPFPVEDEHLVKLGYKITKGQPMPTVPKKAPHPKYL